MERRLWLAAAVVLAVGCTNEVRSMSNQIEVKAVEMWTLPREGASELHVRTPDGAIQVVATDRDDIQVDAIKKARAESDGDARALLEEMQVTRRRDGDRWIVEASWPNRPRLQREGASSFTNYGREVAFEIRVPRGMRLEARSSDGAVEVTGVREARLHTEDGSIRAREIEGRLDVHTSDGSIRIEGCAGPVAAETSDGSITILQARSPVRATTSDGSIDVELEQAEGPAQVELTTSDGGINLRLPAEISARVQADTEDGHVTMEPATRARFNRGRSHLETVLGDGRGTVRLRTSDGGIHIRLAGGR
jgi:DUF4097 and DUF4098 domain-containing protein YvlB